MTGNIFNGRKGPSEAARYVYALFERLGIAFRGVASGEVSSTNLVGLYGTTGNSSDDLLVSPDSPDSVSAIETESTLASTSLGWPHGYPRYWHRPSSEDKSAKVVAILQGSSQVAKVVFDSTTYYSADPLKELLAAAAIYDEPIGDNKTIERLWVFSYGVSAADYGWYAGKVANPSGSWYLRVFDTKTKEQVAFKSGSTQGMVGAMFPVVSIHPDGSHGVFVTSDWGYVGTGVIGGHTATKTQRSSGIGKIYFSGTLELPSESTSSSGMTSTSTSGQSSSIPNGSGGYTSSGVTESHISGSFSSPEIPALAEYSDTGELLVAYGKSQHTYSYDYSGSYLWTNTSTSSSTPIYNELGQLIRERRVADGSMSSVGAEEATTISKTDNALVLWDGLEVRTREQNLITEYSFTQDHMGGSHIEYEVLANVYPPVVVPETYVGSGPGEVLDESTKSYYTVVDVYRIPVFISLKAKVAAFFVTEQSGTGKNYESTLHVDNAVSPSYGVAAGAGLFRSRMYGGKPPHIFGRFEVYHGDSVYIGPASDHDAGRDDSDWLWNSSDSSSIYAAHTYRRAIPIKGASHSESSLSEPMRLATYGDTYVPLKRYATSPAIDLDRTYGSRAVHAVRMGDLGVISWSKLSGMFSNSTYLGTYGYYITNSPDEKFIKSYGQGVPLDVQGVVSSKLNFDFSSLVAVRRVRPVGS